MAFLFSYFLLPFLRKTFCIILICYCCSFYFIFPGCLGSIGLIEVDSSQLTTSTRDIVEVTTSRIKNGLLPIMESKYYGVEIIEILDPKVSVFYEITNVSQGFDYHVRVSAWNSAGNSFGKTMGSYPALTKPLSNPSIISNVDFTILSDDTIQVSWIPPIETGGSNIVKYRIEYDYAPIQSEIQAITIKHYGNISGSFCLIFEESSTRPMNYDITHGALQYELEMLENIFQVNVSKNYDNDDLLHYITWIVTFVDNYGNLPLLKLGCNSLIGDSIEVLITTVNEGVSSNFNSGTIGINERALGDIEINLSQSIVSITVNATSTDLYGSFYVINGGETSIPIDVYSTADDMKEILENMLTINQVEVNIIDYSLLSISKVGYGRTWLITFIEPNTHSIQISTGYKNSLVSSGGTLKGSNNLVSVQFISSSLSSDLLSQGIISELSSFKKYIFRISSYNGEFWSLPYIIPRSISVYKVPPLSPTDVFISLISDSMIFVNWKPPYKFNKDDISGYLIEWSTFSTFCCELQSIFVPNNLVTYTISDLQSTKRYYVRISTYNSAGYSDFTIATSTTPWQTQYLTISSNDLSLLHSLSSPSPSYNLILTNGKQNQRSHDISPFASSDEIQFILQELENIIAVFVERVDPLL